MMKYEKSFSSKLDYEPSIFKDQSGSRKNFKVVIEKQQMEPL